LHVGGVPGLRMATRTGQDHHLAVTLSNQGLKMRVVDVGGGTIPGTHQAPVVHDETELPADNPPMMALPLLANLGGAASFPHGVDQLNPIAVCNAQHRRGCQKAHRPRGVGLEEPCQAGTLRPLGKQRHGVAEQPAIKCPHPLGRAHLAQPISTWMRYCRSQPARFRLTLLPRLGPLSRCQRVKAI
jgi:hypothetical protein